ncbi:MAG: hypothetical protein GTO63_22510 [Anaerolineae bacterium]|nr:hypothetical protein [Anaerolineae bacterium]NIN97554.1 hypothetical protein [Anaerolineae bacterium]NIQ80482.1 hypothetical protein [Anaerolineae bacterium]
MKDEIEVILEGCLTELLSEGASLAECVAEYPDQAVILRPLLELALEIDAVERPEMRPAASKAAKQRMLAALPERRRQAAAPSSTFRRVAAELGALLGGGVHTAPRRAPVASLAIAAVILLMLFVIPDVALQISRGGVVAQTALLADATGVVEVQRSASSDWRPTEAGDVLQAGDGIRTGRFSSVTLAFFDGTTTRLAADTEVTLVELNCRRDGAAKTVVLHQWSGRTHNWVQKFLDAASRFEIDTPTAVATVHGTEFTVNVASDNSTEVVVVEGLVSVETEETTVLLSAGESAATPPRYVLAPPVATPTEEPTDSAEPTETPEPTAEQWRTLIRSLIPTPTATPEPTATAEPTGTPEPTPTGALAAWPEDGDKPPPEHPEHPHGGPPGQDEDKPDRPGKKD